MNFHAAEEEDVVSLFAELPPESELDEPEEPDELEPLDEPEELGEVDEPPLFPDEL
jgi:hypothetical protein